MAQVAIQGQYISFAAASDGNGGILITDPPQGTSAPVTISTNGSITNVTQTNTDGSAVNNYYQNGALLTQNARGANGSGCVTWSGKGSATYTPGAGGITVQASATPDTVTLSGNGTLSDGSTYPLSASVLNNSQMTFITLGSAIMAASNDTIALSGTNDKVTLGGTDTVQLGSPTLGFSNLAQTLTGLGLSGFDKTDMLDIRDLLPSSLKLAFTENAAGTLGTLAISNGSSILDITLSGHYVPSGFSSHSDGSGGVSIGYTLG